MSNVFYDSPYNSTFFTTCCKVAINNDQEKCPACRRDVYPFYEGMTDKERREAGGGYYNHNTNMARSSSARRRGY